MTLQFKRQFELAAREAARRHSLSGQGRDQSRDWLAYHESGGSLLVRQGGAEKLVMPAARRGGCFEIPGAAPEINPPEFDALAVAPISFGNLLPLPDALPDATQVTLSARQVAVCRAAGGSVVVVTEQRRHWEIQISGGAVRLGADRASLLDALAELRQPPPTRSWEDESTDYLIFAPAATAILLHEVAVHPLEADHPAAKNVRAGSQLLPLPLTLTDAPRHAGSGLEMAVDDEGEATAAKVLVRGGRVVNLLTTRASAGPGAAGNGRRADFLCPVLPRASVLCVSGGETAKEALLAGRGRRLLIQRLSGHLQGEKISLRVEAACRLAGGEPAESLRPFTLRWRRRELLNALHAASGETDGPHGAVCEKQGQRLPVAGYAPWLAVKL